jgi:hypothetical protein
LRSHGPTHLAVILRRVSLGNWCDHCEILATNLERTKGGGKMVTDGLATVATNSHGYDAKDTWKRKDIVTKPRCVVPRQ